MPEELERIVLPPEVDSELPDSAELVVLCPYGGGEFIEDRAMMLLLLP